MGFQKLLQITSLFIIIIVIVAVVIGFSLYLLPSPVESSNIPDPKSLDAFVLGIANHEIANPRTGTLYNVSLPANFSGIEVSTVRIRTSSFWSRGLNYSFLHFPPRIIPQPNVKRMAIIYSNLGNWSSYYFSVPNHTIIAPVLGFMAYVSSETTLIDPEKMKMNLTILGDPIALRFPQIDPKGENHEEPICAQFGENGSIEYSNMSRPYVCETQRQGYYTLVAPLPVKADAENKIGIRRRIWLGLGIVGLVILGLCFVGIVRLVKKMKIRKMERNSQTCEPFDTFWVGDSKMPAASVTRTHAILENGDPPC